MMTLPSSSSSNRSSFSTITNHTEKSHQTPPINSLKFTTKLDNSKPSVLVPSEECNESRKRKEPEKEEINVGLMLYDQSWFGIKKNTQNKKTKILDPTAYVGPKKSPEDIRVAKKLRSFRVYSHEEEDAEKIMGVQTKLKLFDDPWKIRKVLTASDCNHMYRLMLAKYLVQKNIINVWNHVGCTDDVTKIRTDGVAVEVLNYDREKEYKLKLKNIRSSDNYMFIHNWISEFVKERRLKRGDEIGMYWSNMHWRLVFSVLARAHTA